MRLDSRILYAFIFKMLSVEIRLEKHGNIPNSVVDGSKLGHICLFVLSKC